jgi:hypothetical protein
MIRNWKSLISATICAVAFGRALAQAPQFATLDIEWENAVGYVEDLADPSKLVTSASTIDANIRNFMPYFGIADIVSVNGKPARGPGSLAAGLCSSLPALHLARRSETLVEERWSIYTWRFSRATEHALARS